MADELSLLWRLRPDVSGVKPAVAETRAAVAQLRQTLGPELTQSVTVANQAFSSIADNLNVFVGQRIPLVGGAFVRVTENLRGFGSEAQKQEQAVRKVSDAITDLSSKTGKSTPQITQFLTHFAKIEGQANRDAAALKFFGAEAIANNQKLIPEAEKAATALSEVAVNAKDAGAGLGAMAGPIAIAIVGMAATAVGAGKLAKALFGLAESSAEVEGKLFDLSQQTGVNVETLSAFEVLAKTTGGEVGNLTQSLTAFQRVLADAQDPTSKQANLLRSLGIEATDTESALRQALAALARMPEGFSQTNAAAELFGARGGKQFLAILKESKGDLDGTIERLREMGILISEADAKAADEFNDQLALLNFQIRATGAVIGREVLPVALDALRQLSRAIRDNREAINALADAAGLLARVFTNPLRGAILVVTAAWETAKPTILGIQEAYEAIAAAAAFIAGHPILPTTRGAPTEPAKEEPTPKDAGSEIRRKLQSQLQAQRELLTTQTAFFDQEKTLAANRIALAERELNEGKRTQREKLSATIEANRQLRDADLKQLEFRRSALVTEAALAKDDLKRRTELEAEIVTIDQKAKDRRAQFDREVADLRSAQRVKERDDEIAHQESLLEIRTQFDAARIVSIEAEVKAGTKAALDGEREISDIQIAALDREETFLFKKLEVAGREPSLRRAILDQIKLLEAERTLLLKQQEDKRTSIIRESFETQKQIQLNQIDSLIEVERTRGESIIAIVRSLAEARLVTEEEAAKRILKIRLDLIDDELRATQAKLKATGSITDVNERTRAQEELNARIRILTTERVAIEAQGERDIEEGRQRDLDNERRYAAELEEIQEDTRRTRRETTEDVIRLMRLHFADRKEIIRAQRDLELAEEEDRHKRETDSIDRQKREVDEQIKVLEKYIARLKVGTQEEIEEHDRLIASLERLRLKRLELENQQRAEDERNRTRKRRVKKESEEEEKDVDPLEKIKISIEDLKKITQELESSVLPLADVLKNAFLGVADAIGSVVANWVLLGTTGPAVMRKILAQALASIAAEAAVNAIKMTAVGFAKLAMFDFAGAANAFVSAGLWASIAGVSALAGRGLAGGLFRQQTGTGGGGGARGGSTSGTSEPNPIDITRNRAQPQVIILHIESNDSHIVRVVEQDVNRNGSLRQLIVRTSEA